MNQTNTPYFGKQNLHPLGSGWPDNLAYDEDPQEPAMMLPCEQDEEKNRADAAFMHKLYTNINIRIKPYVDGVLNTYEYEGSPVYDAYFDPESLAQVVDKVLSEARAHISEIAEITNETAFFGWGRPMLLRAVIEALVLNELFGHRRPIYRKILRENEAYERYQ